nr:RNA-directed DNA polymerase, eukaryota, reverse transcriptase zinc-binding domain protein [Tanacetum cinerariifolium]
IIAIEGLHVAMEDAMAAGLYNGCKIRLPIDCNMALVKSWYLIIGKFSKRLTKWKASLLSIGGRTTLISSVLGALDKGGLGIGSLYSLNHALIQKWRWRFLHNPHALWARLRLTFMVRTKILHPSLAISKIKVFGAELLAQLISCMKKALYPILPCKGK